MERKIGEIFEYEGVTLKTIEAFGCDTCYFNGGGCLVSKAVRGVCSRGNRSDKKPIIFKQITEEQKMNNQEAQILWYKQKLELLEQGKTENPDWEHRPLDGSSKWFRIDNPSWISGFEYRPRQKRIVIHGIEFPEPLKVEPSWVSKYWYLEFRALVAFVDSYSWRGDETDKTLFQQGNVYPDKETALEALKAFKQLFGSLRPESYWNFD